MPLWAAAGGGFTTPRLTEAVQEDLVQDKPPYIPKDVFGLYDLTKGQPQSTTVSNSTSIG